MQPAALRASETLESLVCEQHVDSFFTQPFSVVFPCFVSRLTLGVDWYSVVGEQNRKALFKSRQFKIPPRTQLYKNLEIWGTYCQV